MLEIEVPGAAWSLLKTVQDDKVQEAEKEPPSNEELLQLRIAIATTYQQPLEMCKICVDQNPADRTLPCGHQFCAGCLMKSWSTGSCQSFSCPMCREDFSQSLTHLDLETLKCINGLLSSSFSRNMALIG